MSADENPEGTRPPTTDDRAERCETCRYWDGQRGRVDVFGECRRHPPAIVSAFLTDKAIQLEEDELNATRFPLTSQDDWCGEWQPSRQPTV